MRYIRPATNSIVGKRYRLNTPALAIMNQEGQRFRTTIPLGGVVEVIAGPLDENWLLDVEWEGKAMTMFAVDIHVRAELVDGAGP